MAELVEVRDIVERRAVYPWSAGGFPAEGNEIKQREFELDHSLRPGGPGTDPGTFFSSSDTNQTIQGESGSGRGKDEEEAGHAHEGVSAVQDVDVSLIDGSEAEKYHHAADPGEKASGEKKRTCQKEPEQASNPAVIGRNNGKQVEPDSGLEFSHGRQAHPGMRAVPGQPVRIEKQQVRHDQTSIQNAKERNRKRRLRRKEEAIPGFNERPDAHFKSSGLTLYSKKIRARSGGA